MSGDSASSKASRSRSVVAVALGLSAVLFIAIVLWSLTLAPGFFDDGIQLSSAMFVLRGQQPNIDFQSVYPPLNTYFIAAAFHLAGESIVTYRLAQTLVALLVVFAVASLVHQCSRATKAFLVLTILALGAGLGMLQSSTAILASTLVLLLVLRSIVLEGPRRYVRLVLAGVLLGILAMTRLNFALYLLAMFGLDRLTTVVRQRAMSSLRECAVETAGVLLPAAATVSAILLVWGGSSQELVRQTIVVTSQSLAAGVLTPVSPELSLAAARSFALSGLLMAPLPTAWLAIRASAEGAPRAFHLLAAASALTFVASVVVGASHPLALPALVAIQVAAILLARTRLEWLPRDEFVVLLLMALQLHYVLSRPDGGHFYALFPTIAVLIAVVVRAGNFRLKSPLPALLLVVCGPAALYMFRIMFAGLVTGAGAVTALPALLTTEDEALYEGCGGGCGVFRVDPAEFAASRYVRERTTPDEPVFSGLLGAGGLGSNNVRAYWNMRRPAGTRHIIMQRGITTMPEREREIIRDLQERRVRWLLLWAGVGGRAKDAAGGPGPLETFIREKYELDATFGDYQVWRSSSEPEGAPRAAKHGEAP